MPAPRLPLVFELRSKARRYSEVSVDPADPDRLELGHKIYKKIVSGVLYPCAGAGKLSTSVHLRRGLDQPSTTRAEWEILQCGDYDKAIVDDLRMQFMVEGLTVKVIPVYKKVEYITIKYRFRTFVLHSKVPDEYVIKLSWDDSAQSKCIEIPKLLGL